MFSFIFVIPSQILLLTPGIRTAKKIGYVPQYTTPSQTAPSNKELNIPKSQIYKTNGKQDTSSIPTEKPLPPLPLALPVQPPQPLNSKKKVAIDASIEWDGWPDGHFEKDFTFEEYNKTGRLKVHWAHKIGGGDRKGDSHAEEWGNGKRSWRQCLGVIKCDNPQCEIITRPNTTPHRMSIQLQKACLCGAELSHYGCAVRSTLWTWLGGVHYENGGMHMHARPTHILHLLPRETIQFERIIKSHPKTGPLALIVGVPEISGPGESVADISDVLLNAHRVSKEKQKIKNLTGDSFIAAFAQFSMDHPGFVVHAQLGEVTVISLQSPFMVSQLVKDGSIDGPVNGTVNDAAHGWWKERTSLLMITSAYSPDLLCWVPGLFSYTNGASAQHFKYHFVGLFQSIAAEAEGRKILVEDHLFSGVSNVRNLP